MKTEFDKQLAQAEKAFKPLEQYLQDKKRLSQAFEALEAKTAKLEMEHKEYLKKAGVLEASMLLGDTSGTEASTLDSGLLNIRDPQDRLAAVRQALALQQEALDGQIKCYTNNPAPH